MYSKVKLFGHPIHPMLVAYPIAFCTATLVAFIILPYRSRTLSFFLARQHDRLHVYTCDTFAGDLVQHYYEEELSQGVETITTGVSVTAFQRAHEVLVCLGNSLDTPVLGPFLAHHALDMGKRYQAARLTGVEAHWQDLGTLKGSDVQRVTTRLEPRGYALYRFRRAT
jgi:hypothetical protein